MGSLTGAPHFVAVADECAIINANCRFVLRLVFSGEPEIKPRLESKLGWFTRFAFRHFFRFPSSPGAATMVPDRLFA